MEAIHAEEAGKVGHQVVALVGHTYTRWEIDMEAIHAEEAGKVGHQVVVLVRHTHTHSMGDWHGSNTCRRSW